MKAESEFLELAQRLELLIRQYEMDQANDLFNTVEFDSIPNSLRPKFAGLARRLAVPAVGLKILWSQIYEHSNPSATVVLEFASCLRKSGLHRQALLWLKRMPTSDATLRELAFIHISLWEYREAREILTDLLSRTSSENSGEFSVLKVNLVSCLIFLGEIDLALQHIAELEETKGYGNHQIYVNAVELRARCLMESGRLLSAYKQLEGILSAAPDKQSVTHLFLKKWRILAQYSEKYDDSLEQELRDVQNFARKIRHWETLRDIDCQIALMRGDSELIAKVYFGTPYGSFKERIQSQWKHGPLPSNFVWRGPKSETEAVTIDSYWEAGSRLGIGQSKHRLLLLLLSDQYKPFSVEKIFDELYRDELYDPFNSKIRVHNLIKDLKKDLADFPVPVNIFSTVAGYRIRPSERVSFRIYSQMVFGSIGEFFISALTAQLGDRPFARSDFESLLGLSPAQGQNRIKDLVSEGYLKQIGKGPGTRYTVK